MKNISRRLFSATENNRVSSRKMIRILSWQGFFFLILWTTSCAIQRKQLTAYQSTCSTIDTGLKHDSRLDSLLFPYRKGVDSLMNVIIGYSAVPMSKAQPECTLGNFMADAQLVIAKERYPAAQIAVMNYGGIRLPYIGAGAISKGKIYELMPFDSKLTILEVPGKVLQVFCDHMAAYGGWPVSGMSFQIKDKKAINVQVEGKAINPQLIYLTVVSDYIANGGDHCSFLQDCKRINVNMLIRDMLLRYIEEHNSKNQMLQPRIENRVSYVD